jgi:large subunit ribosomal protein L5
MARLKDFYDSEVAPALKKEFGYANPMAVPRIDKVVLNVGVGEGTTNPRLLDSVADDIAAITGQRPVVKKARKAIAGFKLRAGMPIGVMVTLRRDRMYEFLDRLLNIGLPRVRDFRGVPTRSFDGRGNYTLGIRDHLIFPELDAGRVERIYGMNISIVTTARTDEEARFLLEQMGMPFQKREERPIAVSV